MKKREKLNQIIIHIFRLSREFIEQGDLLVESLELTSARWQVLGAISMADSPLTVPQIARYMGITRQSVQKHINQMMDDHFCLALDNPDHLRSKCYQLTPEGENAFMSAMLRSNEWINILGADIDAESIKTTLKTLMQLEKALNHSTVPQEFKQ